MIDIDNLSNDDLDAVGFEHDKSRQPGIVMRCMTEVQIKPIDWLWKNRLAKGKVTALAGDGGLGKTTVLLDISARTSRGDVWPDGEGRAPVGSTIILSSEDDPSDTIKPRLAAAIR